MRKLNQIAFVAVLLLLVAGFQNCGRPFSSDIFQSNNNGGAYQGHGKVYLTADCSLADSTTHSVIPGGHLQVRPLEDQNGAFYDDEHVYYLATLTSNFANLSMPVEPVAAASNTQTAASSSSPATIALPLDPNVRSHFRSDVMATQKIVFSVRVVPDDNLVNAGSLSIHYLDGAGQAVDADFELQCQVGHILLHPY